MTAQAINRPSLTRTITLRLAITCFLAIALQLAMVVVRTYLDEDDLNKSYVTRQAQVVLGAIKLRHKGLVFHEARIPAQYSGKYAAFYAFRILTADGQILAERNGGKIREFSPWQDRPSNTQDLWLLDLDTERKLYVVGGVRKKIGDHYVWVEVATFGDPASLYLGIVAAEVLDDVWLPMIPLVVLTLGVATLSVRRSLRSLVQAAAKAEQMSPFDGGDRLDISDMPREAASLAIAINRLLDRVGELVKSQRLFIARAAHELRTPLSVIMLELGRIEDPHMRRLEEDVRTMSRTVARLLTLARLESPETLEMVDLDIGQVADEVVNLLEGWAATTQHQLILKICQPALFTGDANAVREALRNLVENAVRHTPSGTDVYITVGPTGSITVEDEGTGLDPKAVPDLLQPFKKGTSSGDGAGLGLAIVRQAVELHRGSLEIGRSAHGGARFALVLPNQNIALAPGNSVALPA